jgi:hypothetical protein
MAIVVSRVTLANTKLSLSLYRFSPLLVVIAASVPHLSPPMTSNALHILPLLLGTYIAAFWIIHHDTQEVKGRGTRDHHHTEVIASVFGMMVLISVSLVSSLELGVLLGALGCLAGALKPVEVSAEELRSKMKQWGEQARSRSDADIRNGSLIAQSTVIIGFCSLSSLRIVTLSTGPIISGVITLGGILVVSELIVYLLTSHIEYDDPRLKIAGFAATMVGFSLMVSSDTVIFALGYCLVAITSRSVNRTADRKFARAALRGVGEGPGKRELTKYRTAAIISPLIWVPETLPLIGAIGGVILLRSKFVVPKEEIT